jgi:hypothetical protein
LGPAFVPRGSTRCFTLWWVCFKLKLTLHSSFIVRIHCIQVRSLSLSLVKCWSFVYCLKVDLDFRGLFEKQVIGFFRCSFQDELVACGADLHKWCFDYRHLLQGRHEAYSCHWHFKHLLRLNRLGLFRIEFERLNRSACCLSWLKVFWFRFGFDWSFLLHRLCLDATFADVYSCIVRNGTPVHVEVISLVLASCHLVVQERTWEQW